MKDDCDIGDQTLTIILKPSVAEKVTAIAEAEGVEPECWVMEQIGKGINKRWDWQRSKPKGRQDGS